MIQQYSTELVIATDKVRWVFPIIGNVETLNTDQFYQLKTRAREQLKTTLIFQLPGVNDDADCNSTFTISLDKVAKDYKAMLNSAIFFSDTTVKLTEHNALVFPVTFNPLKPIKTTVQLVIKRNTGGHWRFQLNLEATEAELDDVIHIFSPLNTTTIANFKLFNRNNTRDDFIAYFTADSDPEFAISPKIGTFVPNT